MFASISRLIADKAIIFETVYCIQRTCAREFTTIFNDGPALRRLKEVTEGITLTVYESRVVELMHWYQVRTGSYNLEQTLSHTFSCRGIKVMEFHVVNFYPSAK
jgi:hypothetical protein